MKKLCLVFILIFSSCKGIVFEKPYEKPNILLLYVDDLRPCLSQLSFFQFDSRRFHNDLENNLRGQVGHVERFNPHLACEFLLAQCHG